MYNRQAAAEVRVKEIYFRHVFVCNFNISFKMPSINQCTVCLEIEEKLNIEKDEAERETLKLRKK